VRHPLRAALAVPILLLALGPVLPAASTPKEIKFKSRDLERIRDEMNKKKEEKDRLEKEASDLSTSVEKADTQMHNVEQSLQYTRRKESDVQQQVATSKNRHDDLVNNLQERQAALQDCAKTYAVAMILEGPYGLAPTYAKHAVLFRAKETQDAGDETAQEKRSLQTLVETQSILRNEVDRQQSKLGDIRSSKRDKSKQLSKTQSRQELLEGELRELRQSAEELASMIEMLRSKAKQDADEDKRLRKEKEMAGRSPILPRSLPWPVKGKVVMRFGRQEQAESHTPFVSNGIVIETRETSEVSAVADGKVLYAGEFMGYGGTVVVEHPGDWYSVYARLAGWVVEKGQAIKKGDMVGQSRSRTGGGASESYFELRFYGKPTDPMPWLSAQ
jgi:septal ring factor EnvC (AmiA/AmiB activator)